MRISPNFTETEADCNCGCGFMDVDEEFLMFIEDMRVIAQVPFNPTSWCRCPIHNKNSGGIDDSAHTRGTAADFEASSGRERYRFLACFFLAQLYQDCVITLAEARLYLKAMMENSCGIGIADDFVHVDKDHVKPRPAAWSY